MSRGPVLVLDHWQTLWERRYGYTRVVQDDWLAPRCDAWVATLEQAVRAARYQLTRRNDQVPWRVAPRAPSTGAAAASADAVAVGGRMRKTPLPFSRLR